MKEPGKPTVKLNEVHRLLPSLVGLLGIFILELLTPLEIVVVIGYTFPLWYVSHLSLKPASSLTFISVACTGLIAGAALLLSFRHQLYPSTLLLKEGTI